MTLRARLAAVLVAVVVLPLVIGSVLLADALPGAFADQRSGAATALARVAGDAVTALCERARSAAEVAGRGVLSVPSDAPAEQQQVLRSLLDRGLADGLRVTGPGNAVVAQGASADDASDCDSGEPGGAAVAAAVALAPGAPGAPGAAGAAGAVKAVAVVDGAQELAGRLQAASGGALSLLAGEQVVAGAQPAPEVLREAVAAAGSPVVSGRSVALVSPAGPGRPVGVLLVLPVSGAPDVVAPAAAVVLGAALLAGLLALWLARATVRPLKELGEAAARIAAGDLSTTIVVRSHDEVGQLATAFNTMTDELRDQLGALEASRDELRAGLARLGQTLTSTHDLDRILGVVLETALAAIAAGSGAVLLREGDALVVAACRGLPAGVATGTHLTRGSDVVARAAREGVALRLQVSEAGTAPLDPAARGALAVPLRRQDRALGVLVLYDPRPQRAGQDDDPVMLGTLADQAAVAVENVLRHRDVSRMAVTDALTGLADYRSFTDTRAREVDRANRCGRPLGLLLLDVDHFKHVNDTLGHQRRDAVLGELARRVGAQVRDVDTVARYGGEELVVVLPETDVHGAERAAERIRADVARRPFGGLHDVPAHVTVSVGVAVLGVPATSAAGLLRAADEALYDAKRSGRDAWRTAGRGGAGSTAGAVEQGAQAPH